MEDPTSFQYMWMDTWWDAAASKNPLRWGTSDTAADLIKHLNEKRENQGRPVRIKVETDGGHHKKEFKDVASAVSWINDQFQTPPLPQLPLEGDGSTSVREAAGGANDSGYSSAPAPRLTRSISNSPNESVNEDAGLFRFMWADAGLLPIAAMQKLARANPLRWSPAKPPLEIVKALQQAQLYWPERAVLLEGDLPGEHVVKAFANVEGTVSWMQVYLKLPQEPEVTPQDHRCVICLEKQVSVMLMPCRHAVLCEDCAQPILNGRDRCPICRTSVQNHARGQFATDYVDLVEAMNARMEGAASTLHEGMYDNVKPLMVAGAVLATGAAACFVLCPPAVPALAAGAFVVGYVPWFATTVAAFESDDPGSSTMSAQHFFSRDDLRHPLKLMGKIVVMGIVAPLAAIAFFIPYALYKGLSPVAKALVYGLVKATAYVHVYAARPIGEALQNLAQCLAEVAHRAGVSLRDLSLALFDMVASTTERAHRDLLEPLARFFYNRALMPCIHGVQQAVYFACECIAAGSRSAWSNALEPAARGIGNGVSFICTNAIFPVSRWILEKLADALTRGATAMYTYVLEPGGRAVALVAEKIADGCVLTAQGVYHAGSVVGTNLARAAAITYTHVLVPLAGALASGASAVYVYALRPLGSGTYRVLEATAAGMAVAASTVAEYAASGAQLVYVYVLLPGGRVAAFVFTAAAAAVAAVAIPAAQAAGTAASASFEAAQVVATATAGAAQTAGHAVGTAATASFEAAQAVGQEARTAAGAMGIR